MSDIDQTAIEQIYRNWAKVYEWLTPIYLLGNEKHLRKKTIASLHLQPGQTVLDVACGTGRNFPLILEKIGSTGKLVGVDYTSDMLARAKERVECEGWKNVELIQADAARIELGRTFYAALSTLAISVIRITAAHWTGCLPTLNRVDTWRLGTPNTVPASMVVPLTGWPIYWGPAQLG